MAENTDGAIELDLDLPDPKEADKGKKAAEKVPETPAEKTNESPSAEEAMAALKKQLEERDASVAEANARAAHAEASARQASDGYVRAQTDTRTANMNMVNTAIETVKREAEMLEGSLANAMQAQDFAAAAKIQTHISTNAAKLVQLETGKEAMEAEAKLPIKRMDPPKDPVEALASQLSPRSATWVRAHPEFARDQRLQQRMVGAHNVAVSENLAADSDAYFERVETILGLKQPQRQEEQEDPLSEASAPSQRRAPAAAPVSRSGTGNGKRPNSVTLTPEEREVAAMNGMSDREYAEQKLKLIKEGRLN